MKTIISLDAETNGLWGKPFAVAFIRYTEEGDEIERKLFRCPIQGLVNPWVDENVLPAMVDIKETHQSLDEMLAAIGEYWLSVNEESTAMWHMGHIVEVELFRLLVEGKHIGEWDSPYVPIEISAYLQMNGYAPDSVDEYVKTHNLDIENVDGATHNPLYDAIVAAEVYFHISRRSAATPLCDP